MTSSVPVCSNTASIVAAGADSRAENAKKQKRKCLKQSQHSQTWALIDYILLAFLDTCVCWARRALPASHMHRPTIVEAGLGDWSTITPQI